MVKKKFILNFLIIFVIFFLDRISKIYILNIASNNELFNISINPFLNVILVWNTGIGFGLFQLDDATTYNIFTILIVAINLVIIYFQMNRQESLIEKIYVNFQRNIINKLLLS